MSEGWTTDDPLAEAPRIPVGPAVVADLKTLQAADRPVVLTDGEEDLVVMVPVEQYRAQLLAIVRQQARESNVRAALSPNHKAVLDPAELDALLADWDHSRGPRPVVAPAAEHSRAVRISDPPGRRIGRSPRS